MVLEDIMKKGVIINCLTADIFPLVPINKTPIAKLNALTEVTVLSESGYTDYYNIHTLDGIIGCIEKKYVALKQEDST